MPLLLGATPYEFLGTKYMNSYTVAKTRATCNRNLINSCTTSGSCLFSKLAIRYEEHQDAMSKWYGD
jgi:hypothetical protein